MMKSVLAPTCLAAAAVLGAPGAHATVDIPGVELSVGVVSVGEALDDAIAAIRKQNPGMQVFKIPSNSGGVYGVEVHQVDGTPDGKREDGDKGKNIVESYFLQTSDDGKVTLVSRYVRVRQGEGFLATVIGDSLRKKYGLRTTFSSESQSPGALEWRYDRTGKLGPLSLNCGIEGTFARPVGAFMVDGKEHFSMGHVSNTQYNGNCAQGIAAKYDYDKAGVVTSYWVTAVDAGSIFDDLAAKQNAREAAEAARTKAARDAAAKSKGPSL